MYFREQLSTIPISLINITSSMTKNVCVCIKNLHYMLKQIRAR